MGMGKRLAESLPSVRRLYDRAADVLGYDLAKLCFEGPSDDLDSTVYSQPAIFVTSLAALESLRAESPDVVLACEATAGLSLGEYTAMVFAGVMDFEDGLTVVQRRGAAMHSTWPNFAHMEPFWTARDKCASTDAGNSVRLPVMTTRRRPSTFSEPAIAVAAASSECASHGSMPL